MKNGKSDSKVKIIVALIGAAAAIIAAVIGAVAVLGNGNSDGDGVYVGGGGVYIGGDNTGAINITLSEYGGKLDDLKDALSKFSSLPPDIEARIEALEKEINGVKDLAETDAQGAQSQLDASRQQWDAEISELETGVARVRKAQIAALLASFSDQLAEQKERIDALREWESETPGAPIKSPALGDTLSKLEAQISALSGVAQDEQAEGKELTAQMSQLEDGASSLESDIPNLQNEVNQAFSGVTVKLASLDVFQRTGMSDANKIFVVPEYTSYNGNELTSNTGETFNSLITMRENSSLDFKLDRKYQYFQATVCASEHYRSAAENIPSLRTMQWVVITISKVMKDGTTTELYDSGEMKYNFLPEDTGLLDVSGADYLRVAYRTRRIGVGPSIIIGNPTLTYQ